MGLVSELMKQGVKLLMLDVQCPYVHFSDGIFSRDKRLSYEPFDIRDALIIKSEESRAFLENIGINGEIVLTPSHSDDSVSLILDSGECFVGDLEPMEYLAAYEENEKLKKDWELIMSYKPEVVNYAHINRKVITSITDY